MVGAILNNVQVCLLWGGAAAGLWAAWGRWRDRKRVRAALARIDLAASTVIATCNALARANAGPTPVADVTFWVAKGGDGDREAFERAIREGVISADSVRAPLAPAEVEPKHLQSGAPA